MSTPIQSPIVAMTAMISGAQIELGTYYNLLFIGGQDPSIDQSMLPAIVCSVIDTEENYYQECTGEFQLDLVIKYDNVKNDNDNFIEHYNAVWNLKKALMNLPIFQEGYLVNTRITMNGGSIEQMAPSFEDEDARIMLGSLKVSYGVTY